MAGPLTCTVIWVNPTTDKFCGREGVATYRRNENDFHIVCRTHDNKSRDREARRMGYVRYEL